MLGGCVSLVVSAMFLATSPNSRKTDGSKLRQSTATTSDATGAPGTLKREFCFVPYGQSFPDDSSSSSSVQDRPSITCDGRIARTDGGPHLELTHWTNHQTPRELYADTSTNIALNLAKLRRKEQQESKDKANRNRKFSFEDFDNALVINNHWDTDGVLSVWSCVDPDAALKHADLLVQGAEAGDFGEWSSDNGVKLDCALSALSRDFSDDEAAYNAILPKLPDMLSDFEATGGQSYEHLWRNGRWEQALSDWQVIQEGRIKLERYKDSRLVLVHEKQQRPPLLSPYALDRGLREAGLWSDTTRILRVMQQQGDSDKESYSYEYEKIGHGWIQEVVQRHHVPNVDVEQLIQKLQDRFDDSKLWGTGGSNGLVSLCQIRKICTIPPLEIAQALVDLDSGAAA